MDNNLTRVQVYLNPDDVSLLDDLAREIRITRSKIIRDATRAVAARYARITELLATKTVRDNPLVKLIGWEKSRTGKIGLSCDDIYLHD